MTTSTRVETDNILLYPILEDNRITLGVKEEYHLQKLGIGAYRVTILEADKLDHLSHTQHHVVMERRECVLIHNCYSEGGIVAVLIVMEPFKINKDSVLCHFAFPPSKNFDVPVQIHHAPPQQTPISVVPDAPPDQLMDILETFSPDSTSSGVNSITTFELKPAPRKPSVFDNFRQ